MKSINYNKISKTYDQRYNFGAPVGVIELIKKFNSRMHSHFILEVGCGTCHWLSILDTKIRFGLDTSIGMLLNAKNKDNNILLVNGDAECLPYTEKIFDIIYCVHAIHHFKNTILFISEAHRVLKENGVLLIIGMDPHSKKNNWYIYDYFPTTYKNDLLRYPSSDMILNWINHVGFTKCELNNSCYIDYSFIGREIFNDPILHKNGTSHLSLLTKKEFSEGIDIIKKTILLYEGKKEDVVFKTFIPLPCVIGYR